MEQKPKVMKMRPLSGQSSRTAQARQRSIQRRRQRRAKASR